MNENAFQRDRAAAAVNVHIGGLQVYKLGMDYLTSYVQLNALRKSKWWYHVIPKLHMVHG